MTQTLGATAPSAAAGTLVSSGAQLAALLRALAVTAGRSAVRRSLPLYMALIIAAIMIFEGNGLDPRVLIRMIHDSPLLRVVMWSAWLLVTIPAAHAVLASPSSFWLRALPIARWQFFAVQGGFMVLVELPWLLLWTRGGGALLGFAAFCGALGAHGVLVSRVRRPADAALALALAAAILAPAPAWLLAATLPLGLWALRLAWLRAPERGRSPDLPLVRGPRTAALALAHVATLLRGHGALLLRALLFTAMATLFAALALVNNVVVDLATRATYTFGFIAAAVVVAGTSLAGPLLRNEVQARWLLVLTGTPPAVQARAAALAIAGVCGLLGLAHGLVVMAFVGTVGRAPAAWLVGGAALIGGALAAVSLALARRYVSSASRMLIAQIGLVVAAVVAGLVLGAWSPVVWAAVAGGLVLGPRAPTAPAHTAMMGADPGGAMLSVREVCKRLGSREVLDRVSFTCGAGEVAVIVGENGAGKSTLLRVVAGLLEPDRGEIEICGAPLRGGGLAARRALGYVPDATDAFPELLVREFIALTCSLRALPPPARLATARAELGLDRVWDQRLCTLSFGQLKRTCVLAATLGEPQLLVLDEPSNGLDPEGAHIMATLVASRQTAGQATLLSTNDPAFVAVVGGTKHRLEGGRLSPG